MATAEHFPIYFPGEARPPFGTEETCLRIAQIAGWSNGSRLLELGAGSVGLVLAQRLGSHVTVTDPEDAALTPIRERCKTPPLFERIAVQRAAAGRLPFDDQDFDGILVLSQVPLSAGVAMKTLRRHLATKGRLALIYPVKVGRFPLKAAIEHWEKKLGEPLVYPRELTQLVERSGYEPEALETMSDSDLDAYYRTIEASLTKPASDGDTRAKLLREEIDLHRSQAGKASVTFALVVGRRKEPGEKPPPSRDGG